MTDRLPRAPRHVSLAGSSPLVRALAGMSGVDAPVRSDLFAPRLARWVDWTQAIALAAMRAEPPRRSAEPGAGALPSAEWLLRERTRVRNALAARAGEAAADADATNWRSRHAACQQAMDAQIGPLRARVRALLAAGPPALAQLAELDAVMEGVLAPRERTLLATLAGRLDARITARHAAQPPAPGESPQPPDALHEHLQTLLLAELDLRLQPVDALLDALRAAE